MEPAATIFIAGNVVFVIVYLYYMFNRKSKIANIDEKYVLITGCDSGFGRAIAERLDQVGVNVFAACLTDSAVNELKVHSKKMIPFVLDVTNSEQIKNTVALVKKKLPDGKGLWGLVNNAGIADSGFIEWLPMETFRKVADVNLFGLIEVTCQFLPLIKKEKGRVVNMASLAGIQAPPVAAPYSISKFGLVAFTNTLRFEMLAFGVRVCCICPTFFRTNILDTEKLVTGMNTLFEAVNDEVKESYKDVPEKVITNLRNIAGEAPVDLNPVVNVVEDALISTKPKNYYFVGKQSILFRIIASCPTELSDWLFAKVNPIFRPSMISS
ncbi:Dehydrogenase/reductase SDR family member 9 [Trichoplax sp. H2]|nr:Dehydrogenase/reductase SDR family member 9 [Trichoplax sp. H2]|eukprot:RDD45811.1 Dehydrogenase/reductase SDR family member 9 [Trichoplax sp. H2]